MEKSFWKRYLESLMTGSFWKQYLHGDEQLIIEVDNCNCFTPDSFKILEDDSIELTLNEQTFNIANRLFKIDELWDASVGDRMGYVNLNDYKIDCKLIVQNSGLKFNVYGAYMIYPDKCYKLTCAFRPEYMALIIA